MKSIFFAMVEFIKAHVAISVATAVVVTAVGVGSGVAIYQHNHPAPDATEPTVQVDGTGSTDATTPGSESNPSEGVTEPVTEPSLEPVVTEPSTEATEPSTEETTPQEGTEATDPTESEATEPTEPATDATEPPVTEPEPTEPPATEPPMTEPEPTEPEETVPSDPPAPEETVPAEDATMPSEGANAGLLSGIDWSTTTYVGPADPETGISWDGKSPIVYTYADGTTGTEPVAGATYESVPGIITTYEVYDSSLSEEDIGDNVTYCHKCGKQRGNGSNGTCLRWISSGHDCTCCGEYVPAQTCHTCNVG